MLLRHLWRNVPWFVVVPGLTALALGVWGLNTPGLWYDERVTAETTQWGPFIYPWDIAIVPFYVLAWVWTAAGNLDTDWWLRSLSVAATVVAAMATSLAARRLAGQRAGLAAGLLLALMPGVARYSQEARVYAVALALAAMSTWFLVAFLTSENRKWLWGYAAILVPFSALAPFALTVVAGQGLIVAVEKPHSRRRLGQWLVALLALVPGLVLQLYGASKVSSQHDWIPQPTFNGLVDAVVWPGALPAGGDVAVTLSVVVVSCWVLILTSRRALMWGIAALSGLLILWFVSTFFINFWIVRSALPLAVFLAIGAGVAVYRIATWQVLAVAALLFVVTFPQYNASRIEGGRAEDVKSAAQIVSEFGQPGDTINTKSRGWLEFGVRRYATNAEIFNFDESAAGRTWVFSGDARNVNCQAIQEWPIPGGGLLTLCRQLPEGWQADFQ